MTVEKSIAELRGKVEAIRATQLALLVGLGTQGMDLSGLARAARSFAAKSDAQGDVLASLNAELDILDTLASMPRR